MTAIEQTDRENEHELPRIIPDSFDSELDSRNPYVKVEGVVRYGGSVPQASIPGDSLFNQVAEVGGIFFESENKNAIPVGDQNNAEPVRCDSHSSHAFEGEGIELDGNAGSRAEINGKVGGLVIIEGGDVGEREGAKYQVPVGNSTKIDGAMDYLNSINPVNGIISDKIQSKVEIRGTVSAARLATDKQKKFTGRKELYDNALSHPRVLMESLEYNNVGDSSKQHEQCRRGQKNMPLKQKLRQGCKNMHGKENQDQEANNSFPDFEPFFVEDKEGSGGYGTVYSAQRKNDGKKFAIKCPHANANVQHANREREVLKRFGGRNFIIKYEGSFKNGNDDCFILQHVEHDRPEVLRKEINIYQLQWYGYCMFRALASLHKEGMVHRDVKPANFLFSRNLNKGYLIDFNLAMDLHQKYNAGKSKLSHKIQLGTKDATSIIATSAEKLREPILSSGRKELISLVQIQNAMRGPNRDAMNILGSQRKRVATPLSPADTKKIHFSPMPLHSAGVAVPGAGLLRSKDEKSKPDGPCVGTKGFRAPEALFRSLYQSSKVDIWSAGVTLLYLILGKTPFLGDPEHKGCEHVSIRDPASFMEGICKRIVGKIRGDAQAISLIKGMEVKMEGPCMISTLISEQVGVNCCVLMGANIANEIAVEKFSEATVGYRENREIAEKWVQLFSTSYFMVSSVQDVEGVELCGTLKNVVAIAAGIVDGLDMGNNTKAAIMRIGLREMKAFSKLLFPSVRDSTFFESCGVADLITTCLGGRNRKCAEAFARSGGKRSFDELEAEMLKGQKLQGVSTAKEVYEVLRHRGWLELFPLFTTVHEISAGGRPPTAIVEFSELTPKFPLVEGSG